MCIRDRNTPLLSCLNLVEYHKISPDLDIADLILQSTLNMVRFLVQYGGNEHFKNNKLVQPIADVKHRNNKGKNAFDLVYEIWDRLYYDRKHVDYAPTCGNMLSALGPFAIEEGLVEASNEITKINVEFKKNEIPFLRSSIPNP